MSKNPNQSQQKGPVKKKTLFDLAQDKSYEGSGYG
jgi:hypothetical protein